MGKRCLFLFFVVIHLAASAQTPFFQHYVLLKKNDPVQINEIFQDKIGFIWLGTNKGLFKFDGVNLRRFTLADSLGDENVTALQEDSLGRIWIGHGSGRLTIHDNGKLTKFTAREGDPVAAISDIHFDRHGNLWFSTLNDGLYYFVEDRLYRLDEEDGMPDIFIYDIEEDYLGRIWVGTDGGAVICELQDRQVALEVINYDSGLPDNIIKKLVEADDHTIWMGTEDAGIVRYNPVSGKFQSVLVDASRVGSINDFTFSNGQVWIASSGSALSVYDTTTRRLTTYQPGSAMGMVTQLLRDAEGSIWVGSKTGLVRSLGNYVQFIDDLDPAKDRSVVALAVDKGDAIWFSTNEGLYRRSVGHDGTARIEKQLAGTRFEKYKVISLYTDRSGFVWCGFYGEGALRINPVNGQYRYLSSELRNGNVLNITGAEDVVWLSTLGGATRISINGENLTITNLSHAEGLVSDYIYQVFVDSEDRVWFASDRAGIDMLDQGGFHHFLGSLSSKAVYGFAEDGNGGIWANVQNEGLYRFDGEQFILQGPDRDIDIGSVTSDNAGLLIAAHDFGIDLFNTKTNKVRRLDNEVGFGERQPNLNACAKDLHGHVYIGTDHGIVVYSQVPGELLTVPEPRISAFKAFNESRDLKPDLTLAYDENNVTINFLGFWYQNPGGLTFQYRLDGYDLDWITTRDMAAVYSSLPHGNYKFMLRVAESEDFSNSKETSFSFQIKPPFWRTTLFYIASAVAAAFAGYSYIQWRERKLTRDKIVLEMKVNERTMEIQRMNEEIRAQTEEIRTINENLEKMVSDRTSELEKKNKVLEEYAFINAHSLRSPVASILGLINLLCLREMDEDGRLMVNHLKDSAQRLDDVVRSITESIEKEDRYPFNESDADER